MGSSIFTCLVSRGTNWPFILDNPSQTVCRVTSEWHSLPLFGAKGRFPYNLFQKAKVSLKGQGQISLQSIVKKLNSLLSGFLSCYTNPLHAHSFHQGTCGQGESMPTWSSQDYNNKIPCIWPRIMCLKPPYIKLTELLYSLKVEKNLIFYGSYHNRNLFRGWIESFKIGQRVQSSSYTRWITPRDLQDSSLTTANNTALFT